jgi:integrase
MATKRPKLELDKRNGKYYARASIGGKRQRFTFTSNYKESEKQLTHVLHDLNSQPPPPAPSYPQVPLSILPAAPSDPFGGIKLSELMDQHLKWVANNRKPATLYDRKLHVTRFLDYIGDVNVSAVDRWALENFYAWARENHSRGPNGGNAYLRNVKTMFLWAEEVELCPCPVKKFPKMHETLPETKRFTDEELVKLLTRMTDIDFRDMLLFGLLTGLRPQELRGLRKEHIMRDGQGSLYLYIEKHKTARMTHEHKARSVPLVPAAVEIYERQLKAHSEEPLLFVNANGTPYKSRSFRQRLIRWCERAGIKPRSPYALRHTFGSLEAEANVNQAVIGQVMGHTLLQTTTRYIANNYQHHKMAVGAISSRITSALDKQAA